MKLKSLEIKGFKSFADKTIVNFDSNITGIVGPNGCGKSNIVDSIRWVIGEQKISQLRSENLESLVFNGSKTRSASGLAEVSLTFENNRNLLPTEFSTVTITRKFYKNGDSEYRLNDVQCRLKDIQNLFMDTGISTDSYAIIELGMVDDLIKDKDNSRRKMLEQAAGISIYKTRKKEAKQKLSSAEQDIARIEDLLFEINNQLKTLENQAKKAEKYHEIKKEYKEVSIELAKASLEGFNLSYQELNSQLETETDKRIILETSIAGKEAELEKEKVDFIEKEKNLQELQAAFSELLQQVRTHENNKNLITQKLEHLAEREKNLTDFLDKSGNQIKGLDESINFTATQITEETTALENISASLITLKTDAETKQTTYKEQQQLVEKYRSEEIALQRKIFDAEKKSAVADTSIQNFQRMISQLEEENQARKKQSEQSETEKKSVENDLQFKESDLQQLQLHNEKTKEQILQLQVQLESLRNELANENRTLDAKTNEYNLLKSMVDSMEGYPDSVKFLHKNNAWNYASPILSDVIYVKEEYRTALENVLEPYLNYYIVNNLAEGLEAVKLLDSNSKGKANFFLLDKLNEQSGKNTQHPLENALSAMNVIEVDEKYKLLAEYLLGNVYITDNEELLSNSNGHVLIEKNGKYVKGKISLTGGSVGLFEGKKIGRIKNLEKLNKEIGNQAEVVNGLKAKIQIAHNEVMTHNENLREHAIKDAEAAIQKLINTKFSLQNKIENLQIQEANCIKKVDEYKHQLDQTSQSISTVKTEHLGFVEELDILTQNLTGTKELFKAAEAAYNESSQQLNNQTLIETRQNSKVGSLKQELDFKKKHINDLQNQVNINQSQLAETEQNKVDAEKSRTTILQQLESSLKDKEAKQTIVNQADQAYYNYRNSIAEEENLLKQKIKEKEQIEHLIIATKDKLNELKLNLAGTKERLQVEFKIQIDDILTQQRITEDTIEELTVKADKIKKRIENIGEVNPMAIEAYAEMKQRYEFIITQKNDLMSAKDSLLKTIEEVETTANQKFLDTFNKVRENFHHVFHTLFTEDDQCDLVLDNPNDIAETGIEVIAKPKGKKPSSLTQLSGGERTLTATALLFAIYLIKPAPFCILDEVDAPLDDANVSKFTNMIRKFSDNSQFIIVTHNKTTMSTVDVIYGVTMQEPGVSKLVSVDFRNLSKN